VLGQPNTPDIYLSRGISHQTLMSLIQEGIKKGLIKLDDEQKYITYINQNKKRNYSNPEEQVQAETFLKLILTYGYAQKRIRLFVPVAMGSTTKEADIIVYNEDEHKSPHIVVECKKQEEKISVNPSQKTP